jgi:hypothetical protein
MEDPDIYEMLHLLNRLAQERNPAEFEKVLRQFTDEAMAQAD